MIARRSCLAGLATLSLAGLSAVRPAQAAPWPDKVMTWIVPSGAGGLIDGFARPVATRVAAELGQPVVIDNRAGAGGSIGAAFVARAPAEGFAPPAPATSSSGTALTEEA